MNNFKENKTYAKIRDPNSFWYTVGQKFQGCECVIHETKEDSYVVELCDPHQEAVLQGLSVAELSPMLRPAVPQKLEDPKLAIVERMQENFSMPNVYGIISFNSYKTREEAQLVLDKIENLSENDRIGILKCPLCDEYELGKSGDEDHLPNLYCANCKALYGLWDKSYDEALQENQKLKAEIEELKKKYAGQISAVEQLIIDHEKIVKDLIDRKSSVFVIEQESKQAIEVIKRLEDRIESLYTYDDVLSHEQAEYLESILKGDQE